MNFVFDAIIVSVSIILKSAYLCQRFCFCCCFSSRD